MNIADETKHFLVFIVKTGIEFFEPCFESFTMIGHIKAPLFLLFAEVEIVREREITASLKQVCDLFAVMENGSGAKGFRVNDFYPVGEIKDGSSVFGSDVLDLNDLNNGFLHYFTKSSATTSPRIPNSTL